MGRINRRHARPLLLRTALALGGVACASSRDRGDAGLDDDGVASLGDGTGAQTTGVTTLDTTAGADAITSSGEGTKFDLASLPDSPSDCASGGANEDPDFSYIWIANSMESTVSKINTVTLVEEGRYLTRPDGVGNPSRTSVNLNGDAVVANRKGGITMIRARLSDCSGANTSSGPDDVKPWPDDCIAWHTPMIYDSQRPVAWTRGTVNADTCRYEGAKVWTSGADDMIDVLLLDGETGAIEETVPVPTVAAQYYGIYGAAVDSGDHFWGSQLGNGQLVRVDRNDFSVQHWSMPAPGYGIAVDHNNRVWTCDDTVSRFDYVSQTWQTAVAHGSGGCMPDGGDLLWLANDPMVAVHIETLEVMKTIDVPNYVHGVSVDFQGNIWGPAIGQGEAYRVNPETLEIGTVTGLNYPYTYSDMTGFGLSQVGAPPR